MTFKQYRFLRGLHSLSPEMNDEQKYGFHHICDIEKATGLSKEDVLTAATKLELLEYVRLVQNSKAAKERSGYIHLVTITYSGVVAKNEYIKNEALRPITEHNSSCYCINSMFINSTSPYQISKHTNPLLQSPVTEAAM